MDGLAALDIVESMRNPVLVLDADQRVISANRAFCLVFQVSREETQGLLVHELGDGHWDIPRLRELLRAIIPEEAVVEDFEVETAFPGIGQRVMCLNARTVYRQGNHTHRTLLVFEDVTEARQRERDQAQATQEVYHRVRNSLSVIMGFVHHEARRMEGDAAVSMSAIQGRIAAVADLYDLIARSEAQEAVRGDAYLTGIAKSLSASLLGPDTPIRIAVDAEPLSIERDACVPLGLVVNELATNAIKHAFPDGRAGLIQIAFKRHDNLIRLGVADNGVGLAATAASRPVTKAKGFGSRYVGMFVRQLRGTLTESSSPGGGSAFDIRLPLTVVRA
jgi:two-component sensor histidine kinase